MNYGLLQKYEDFYPYSPTSAFLVNGNSYTDLTEILHVSYEIIDFRVLPNHPEVVKTGTHLRLGNFHNNELIYSDNGNIFFGNVLICEGEQPYMNGEYFAYHRNGIIYLNDSKLIDVKEHGWFEGGRPTIYKDYLLFEANKLKESPTTWEIWKHNLKTKKDEFVTMGANPYGFEGRLFYSYWIGSQFETRVMDFS